MSSDGHDERPRGSDAFEIMPAQPTLTRRTKERGVWKPDPELTEEYEERRKYADRPEIARKIRMSFGSLLGMYVCMNVCMDVCVCVCVCVCL